MHRWNLIQEEVRASVEKERRGRMVGLSQLSVWMRWENFMKRRISRSEIWHADASGLKFPVQSVMMYYQVLRTYLLEKSGIQSCPLCAGKGTIRHMSSCPRALGDRRYCWKHDQVLRRVADIVDATIHMSNFKSEAKPIDFVKDRRRPLSAFKINSCLLSTTRDWQSRVDIEERLKVPKQIATNTLRLGLILWSTKTRQIVLIELKFPLEENI